MTWECFSGVNNSIVEKENTCTRNCTKKVLTVKKTMICSMYVIKHEDDAEYNWFLGNLS